MEKAIDTMGALDADILDDAARRYNGLRRRYWRSLLSGVALLGGGGLLAMCEDEFGPLLDPGVKRVLIGWMIAGFLSGWIVNIGAGFSLGQFRCPRCGRRFILAWWSNWPTDRCKHCGLDLGPAAIAAKPLPARPEPLSSKAGIWDHNFDGLP